MDPISWYLQPKLFAVCIINKPSNMAGPAPTLEVLIRKSGLVHGQVLEINEELSTAEIST